MELNIEPVNEHFWSEELLTIEEQEEIYERDKKRLEALSRLSNNEDFKYLFFDQLFVKEAAGCVKVIDSERAMNNEKLKNLIEAKLLTISGLQRWFNAVIASGRIAPDNIKALHENIEEQE